MESQMEAQMGRRTIHCHARRTRPRVSTTGENNRAECQGGDVRQTTHATLQGACALDGAQPATDVRWCGFVCLVCRFRSPATSCLLGLQVAVQGARVAEVVLHGVPWPAQTAWPIPIARNVVASARPLTQSSSRGESAVEPLMRAGHGGRERGEAREGHRRTSEGS